jgi:hypothetical protein
MVNGTIEGDACERVAMMFSKPMATIGKAELCKMILAQYAAINRLIDELRAADPLNPLLPPRQPKV